MKSTSSATTHQLGMRRYLISLTDAMIRMIPNRPATIQRAASMASGIFLIGRVVRFHAFPFDGDIHPPDV
jgi:hypothetical protein